MTTDWSNIADGGQPRERTAMGMEDSNDGEIHHDVFVTYRPPEVCPRCLNLTPLQAAMGVKVSKEEAAMQGGEIPATCTHVRRADYERLLNSYRRKEVTILGIEQAILRDGTVQQVVSWQEVPITKRGKGDPTFPGRPGPQNPF